MDAYDYVITPGISQETLNRGVRPLQSWDTQDLSTPEKMVRWASEWPRSVLIEDNLSFMVMDDNLGKPEVKVFAAIGNKVLYYNLAYVKVKELNRLSGCTQPQVSKAINTLIKEKYLKVLHINTFGTGSRVYLVHPAFFWKGPDYTRFKFRMKWDNINYQERVL